MPGLEAPIIIKVTGKQCDWLRFARVGPRGRARAWLWITGVRLITPDAFGKPTALEMVAPRLLSCPEQATIAITQFRNGSTRHADLVERVPLEWQGMRGAERMWAFMVGGR